MATTAIAPVQAPARTTGYPPPPLVPLFPVGADSLTKIFYSAVDQFGEREALRWKTNGSWQSLSYREVERQVTGVAAALRGWGIEPGDRVAVFSENRPEWAIADYAILGIGGITVPIYPTLPADQAAHILDDSGARLVFVSTRAQFEKLREVRAQLPALERVVGFEDLGPGGETMPRQAENDPMELERSARFRRQAWGVNRDALATIIYTSGTTGTPKGVMLTHFNLAAMVTASRQHGSLPVEVGMVALSILPLSHIFERLADYYLWNNGVTIAYAESITNVGANLQEVHPDVMVSVPRLYDKIYTKVMNVPGLKGRLVRWAARVGSQVVEETLTGRRAPLLLRIEHRLADLLVFRKMRHQIGGRMKIMICGGAPLSPQVAKFFFAAGLPVYEGYGLTETAPVLAANRRDTVRLGTVGKPYPGVEIRIAENGEILARGPSVMRGYWNHSTATEAALDREGWFHTGDVGEFDADGFLRITDRIKDLIVTAGGKKIAPQPIEGRTTLSPFIAQAIMVGDRRPFPSMLVIPDFERLLSWAAERGINGADRDGLLQERCIRELLEQESLGRLQHLAQFERPKKIAILAEELTVESGLLTPTMKVKRRQVETRFREVIEALYAEEAV